MLAFETKTGDPIVAGGVRLVPTARAMRVTLGRISLAWTRPIGVTVESGDHESSRMPIRDGTRCWQLAILGAGLLGSLVLGLAGRRRKL